MIVNTELSWCHIMSIYIESSNAARDETYRLYTVIQHDKTERRK